MLIPRVRFAPSPTGYLHVGGARTALFNWLYARRHGGVFILRIEDTDAERSSWDMVEGILEGMRWLGLEWDEGPDIGGQYGPYFQSQRLDRYRAMAERLVSDGRAYYCYCSPETLTRKRQDAEVRGMSWKYDRACCGLRADEVASLEAAGAARAVRFKVPERQTGFNDLVHGPITFSGENIEDFVVLRSDLHPTYHLSVVVDDIDMRITHVLRGDDHISNTPKQVLLYEAFGAPLPRFAHVPLILGPDKKRLSKRHGATSVMEYQRQGYLPEAMVNFLALLGWSPGTDQEVFGRNQLVEAFMLEGISGSQAVFNREKLDWFNGQHLARLSTDELAQRLTPAMRAGGLWSDDYAGPRHDWFLQVLDLLRPRSRTLLDFVSQGRVFFSEAVEYDPAAVKKHLSSSGLASHLAALRQGLREANPFDATTTEAALRAVAAARGVETALLIHATRVGVTGQAVSPGLFEVLALLGRERTLARLEGVERLLDSPRWA